MIPQSAIQQWTLTHPWQLDTQVEQDLLLEAVLHRAAESDSFDQLTFIGGTCLHKLYGSGPRRYSEDLDFVWMGDGADRLRVCEGSFLRLGLMWWGWWEVEGLEGIGFIFLLATPPVGRVGAPGGCVAYRSQPC